MFQIMHKKKLNKLSDCKVGNPLLTMHNNLPDRKERACGRTSVEYHDLFSIRHVTNLHING